MASNAFTKMKGGDLFGNKQRRRNLAREKATYQKSRSGVESMLGSLSGRAEEAYGDAEQTAEQRYGRQLQTARDTVGQNLASTQSGIMRMGLSGGGDASGRAGVQMLGATQGANESYQDITNAFEDRTEAANRFDLSRGDRLSDAALSGRTGLMGLDRQSLEAERERQLQRKQAIAQFGSDLIGGAASVFAAGAGGGK